MWLLVESGDATSHIWKKKIGSRDEEKASQVEREFLFSKLLTVDRIWI